MKLLNKNRYTIIFTFIFILSANVSCKKYLEIKPDSKLSIPTTIADLQGILDFTNDMNLQSTPGFGTSSSDESYLLESAYNSFTSEAQKIYTWNRGDYYYQNSWAKAYLPVFNANFCLEQIDKIPITDKLKLQWENIKGSALFYRSYYFLGLLWDFSKAYDPTSANSDLGIVLRLGSDFNVPSTRASVKECYDKVIEDAKLSATYLPDYPFHVMRPSKGAAYGLLARAYLSMRVYDSAFRYAGLCLQLNQELIDYNSDSDINGNIGADVPFKRFNKETIFYTEMNQNDLLNTPSRAKIDTLLYSMYDNNDLRKAAFFKPSSGYRFKSIYTGNISQYFSGIATDEIYLIKAECGARIGKISEAMNDLNTLMKKRWKNTVPFPVVTATDATDAIQKILTERRKELLMRGIRWIDIKRLNKENANIVLVRKMGGLTYTLAPNANYYALPIPADIIQASGIPQNEK